jgi:prepilin-type N-terminal cleavage/methylation domain-containing protein
MKATATRHGFTLVEAIVVMGLLCVLLAAYALTRSGGERQAVDLDFRASSLRSAQLVFAIVKADFDNYRPGAARPELAVPVPQEEVSFARLSGGKLLLDAANQPGTETVTYRFDRARHRLLRNGAVIEAGPFEAVRFTFAPAGPPGQESRQGDVLRIEIEAVPPEFLGRAGKGTPHAQFALEMAAIQGAVDRAYDRWVSGE